MQPEISVIIPTSRRPASLRRALDKILVCEPAPAEVLVHVDAGDTETVPMIEREFADKATWFQSEITQGPGGGRNHLLQRAKYPIVASFDDDSWPFDKDYFATASQLMWANPQAGVLTGRVTSRGETPAEKTDALTQTASFEGGACVHRREAFFSTSGFLPLRYAYGMEEVDVALQLLDKGWVILRTSSLRIFHDSELQHHISPKINAKHITNTALLAYLRYPIGYWPLGILQIMNRILYSLKKRRFQGVLNGLLAIPFIIGKYRRYRQPVKSDTLRRSRKLLKQK
jgi:GT2 family glycosyltransferase